MIFLFVICALIPHTVLTSRWYSFVHLFLHFVPITVCCYYSDERCLCRIHVITCCHFVTFHSPFGRLLGHAPRTTGIPSPHAAFPPHCHLLYARVRLRVVGLLILVVIHLYLLRNGTHHTLPRAITHRTLLPPPTHALHFTTPLQHITILRITILHHLPHTGAPSLLTEPH